MAVVCDTGAIYALYDADDANHSACRQFVETNREPFLLPVVLLAEIDYLLTTRLGNEAAFEFLESIESGAFTLISLTTDDIPRCRELMVQYRDLPIGLADATVVATAERLAIQRLFTVDQRHFRAIRPHGFDHFIILPADREVE
jgi:predicted nucleic acid-binding protein